ncbi:MAG: hypothetical protein IPL49_16915 [Saprospirales bacterium]|nr:hypothetical protein [Saprospirales bacterium]MBK8492516.1 hypothetical protein [Saprospirales bacterium]
MKRLAILFLTLSPLLFTSCFEILEEVYLKKDGSGTYLYTIDMSAIMDESMKELLASATEEGEANSLDGVEIDSVIYFKDANPQEIAELSRPEVFKRGFMKIQMSDEQDKMVMQFGLDFENVEEIDYFLKNLDKVSSDGMQGGEMGKGLLLTSKAAEMFSLKGKKLSRLSSPSLGNEEVNDEDMGMLSLFMESATFTTIYHLPGNVKKTTIPGAVIDGKTITVESSLLDLMNGESAQSGWIKFK